MFGRVFERAGSHLSRWARDEAGNTTVEWVLLVGGLVSLSIFVMLSIGDSWAYAGREAASTARASAERRLRSADICRFLEAMCFVDCGN